MKRKVVQQGPATLMVSLPSKWAKKYNIKKGDELDIEEIPGRLILGKKVEPIVQRTSINISNQDTMIHRIIAAIYKAGYDEVSIRYSKSEELEKIQERIERNLVEFDIAEYKENSVIVKSISKLDSEHFNMVFRKVFFTINDIANDILDKISKNDYDSLKSIIIRDKSLDKYTDYCRRLLNKRIETEFKRPKTMYYIIEEIEIIGDMYKDLCEEIIKNKIVLSKELKSFFDEINKFLRRFSDLVFDFEMNKVREFGEERLKLNEKADNLIRRLNRKENKVLFLLIQIFNAIFEMKSALITEFI